MRPLTLDIHGFASFRGQCTIDFTDTDFFALVGPTGSGKSTVIDAMVFALYGSAPRWDRRNAVQYALAPTANRATVRLTFTVGGQRYVVAREVRRSTQGVSQKTVSLERVLDVTQPETAEPVTESLAGDIKGVNTEIERLLGLSFEDFCQCVVLPQGRFAEFLRATVKERQDILLKLLGAAHYERIREAASSRAIAAEGRSSLVRAQLEAVPPVTELDEQTATDRVGELTTLAATVDEMTTQIASAATALERAATELDNCAADRRLLAGVSIPPEVASIQQLLTDARADLTTATAAQTRAVQAHDRARRELDDAGSRSTWERLHQSWQDSRETQAALPQAAATLAALDQQAQTQAAEARASEQAADDARQRQHTAERSAQDAAAAVVTVQTRLAALRGLRQPPGVHELAARATALAGAQRAARDRVAQAEAEAGAARQALSGTPARDDLVSARRLLDQLDRAATTLLDRRTTSTRAHDVVTHTEQALSAARARTTEAEAAYEQLRAQHVAHQVRGQLAVGHACPVCEQVVTTLPPAHPAGALDEAQQQLLAPRQAAETAAAEHQSALTAHATAEHAATNAAAEQARLLAELDTLNAPTDRQEVLTALAAVDQAQSRSSTAEDEARAARAALDTAADAVHALQGDLREATRQLRAASAALPGAPDPADDPATGWAELTAWASEEQDRVAEHELPAATTTQDDVAAALTRATADADAAALARQQAQQAERSTAEQRAAAAVRHEQLTSRNTHLVATLQGQPDETTVATALARLEAAEAAERVAYQALTARRQAQEAAEDAARRAEAGFADARRHLERTRDDVVRLGAPALDGDDLAEAWRQLLTWASEEAARTAVRHAALSEASEAARQAHEQVVDRLRTTMRDHAITVEEPATPARTAAAVTRAVEAAKHEAQRIAGALVERARLTTDLAGAEGERQVAKMLAELLRATKFQRWLAGAALETLVLGASVSLRELSNGQFDLTHHDGDFYVIDHADAESERSVRTLSGGETFQASLALALALSEQLSALSAGNSTRLESIILDEGFGTLDADSLDVVASTLERLADGERLVGIVTHVRELAERIPVRYRVRRDTTGSKVTRLESGLE